MTTMEVIALVIGSGGIGAILSALVNWAANRGQVRIDYFRAIVDALNKRIDDLQEEIDTLKTQLDDEQSQHEVTRARFRSALRYIRSMMSWLSSGRHGEPPAVPLDLMDDI